MATSAGGDPSYIEVPATVGTPLVTFTFDVWVRQTHFNSYPASNRMVVSTSWTESFPGPGAGRAQIYLHENQGYYFYVKVGAGTVRGTDWEVCTLAQPKTIAVDSWVRLTGTYDGVTLRCYSDGKETGSTPLTSLNAGALGPMVIGRNYPGDVDAVRIYNHARAASQIATPWP